MILNIEITDSVLSAQQITRLSDSEFKCELPTMNFFGTKIQPILYVDVNVYPEFNRSEIVVRRAETIGSETALKVNGTFSISAINIVSAGKIQTLILNITLHSIFWERNLCRIIFNIKFYFFFVHFFIPLYFVFFYYFISLFLINCRCR